MTCEGRVTAAPVVGGPQYRLRKNGRAVDSIAVN